MPTKTRESKLDKSSQGLCRLLRPRDCVEAVDLTGIGIGYFTPTCARQDNLFESEIRSCDIMLCERKRTTQLSVPRVDVMSRQRRSRYSTNTKFRRQHGGLGLDTKHGLS